MRHDEHESRVPVMARLTQSNGVGQHYRGALLDNLALRFTDHRLHIRRARGGLLCVIAESSANAPALKMALALVARRLAELERPPREPSSPAPSLSPTTERTPRTKPSTIPAAPSAKKTPLFCRGYRVDD